LSCQHKSTSAYKVTFLLFQLPLMFIQLYILKSLIICPRLVSVYESVSNVIFKIPLLDEWFLSSRCVLFFFFLGPYMWLLAIASERWVVERLFIVFELMVNLRKSILICQPMKYWKKIYTSVSVSIFSKWGCIKEEENSHLYKTYIK